MDRVSKFRQDLVIAMGCEPLVLDEAGVTVLGHPDRAESKVTAGYQLGPHLVVTCDPAVEAKLQAATKNMEPSLEGWQRVAADCEGEFLGSGRMQLLGDSTVAMPTLPDGYQFRRLTLQSDLDRELIANLIAASSADDLDEAELYMDALDEIIEVIIGPTGAIAAYASAHPFDLAPGYGDIGVLTRSDARNSGLGAAVVQQLCQRLATEGLEPLYRCDEDNVGSIRLSAAIGFAPATQLTAYRFRN